MNKIKICILSQGAYPLLEPSNNGKSVGGAEVQLVTLGQHLASKGYDVYFLVGESNQPDRVPIAKRITAIKVPLRYMGGPNFYLVPDWLKLLYSLWQTDADIHLIKLPNHLLFALGIYCALIRKKLIFISQIDRDVDLALQKQKVNSLQYWLYRIGLLLTHHIVCQNVSQKRNIEKFCSKRASVIRNIIAFDSTRSLQKQKFILWVGSNLLRKRPELFLEMAKRCPDLSFKMIMNTTNQTPDDSPIKTQCQQFLNLEYLGAVPFREIAKFFQAAALLVSTSELEGFPNIFLHAWQFETPVVSLNIDPDGLMTKKRMGRVSLSLEKMAQDIRELMEDDDLRNRLGANGRKYVDEYHNTDKIVDQYCNLFDSLLNGPKNRLISH